MNEYIVEAQFYEGAEGYPSGRFDGKMNVIAADPDAAREFFVNYIQNRYPNGLASDVKVTAPKTYMLNFQASPAK